MTNRALTSSLHRFFSSIVANRIKIVLPSIIKPDQTGFISGRFIGENTRLIFDTIYHCDVEEK